VRQASALTHERGHASPQIVNSEWWTRDCDDGQPHPMDGVADTPKFPSHCIWLLCVKSCLQCVDVKKLFSYIHHSSCLKNLLPR